MLPRLASLIHYSDNVKLLTLEATALREAYAATSARGKDLGDYTTGQ